MRFLMVLLFSFIVLSLLTLLWPRISPVPRPEPLGQLNSVLRRTQIGNNAASVLGVTSEASASPITVHGVWQGAVSGIQQKTTDLLITHLSRLIIDRFQTLSEEDQQRILEALTESLNQPKPSPTQELPQSSEQSTEGNN